jgi:hypothetical protein
MTPGARKAAFLLGGVLRARGAATPCGPLGAGGPGAGRAAHDAACGAGASTSGAAGGSAAAAGRGGGRGAAPRRAWPASAPGTAPGAPRAFSSWEAHWASPVRAALHSDIAAARSMLPHRAQFVPQFSAHGFQLVPESLLSPLAAALQHAPPGPPGAGLDLSSGAGLAAAGHAALHAPGGHAAAHAPLHAPPHAGGHAGSPLYADSVKRKRKLAMKRHKYRKRMRALKAVLKK